MAGWISALARTRDALAGALRRAFRVDRLDAATREELEATLLGADVPAALSAEWLDELDRTPPRGRSRHDVLADILARSLRPPQFAWTRGPVPLSILVVGVNGSGKTTTCAKLAHHAKRAGLTPLLGAGDTFRAAGSEQLRLWAARVGCEVVAGATGADPASVAYDAVEAAVVRKADALIFDTAGRMHTRQPLMQELEKVRRAMGKRLEGAPQETWIVLDAALGRNAIAQARQFHAAVPLSGVIVSKLDGSAKGGFVFSIARELNLPILYAGLGEGADDLAPFDPAGFVRALLETGDAPEA